jgi:hypothetical protein
MLLPREPFVSGKVQVKMIDRSGKEVRTMTIVRPPPVYVNEDIVYHLRDGQYVEFCPPE